MVVKDDDESYEYALVIDWVITIKTKSDKKEHF